MKKIAHHPIILIITIIVLLIISFYFTISYLEGHSRDDISKTLANQLSTSKQAINAWTRSSYKRMRWLQSDSTTVKLVELVINSPLTKGLNSKLQKRVNNHLKNIVKAVGDKGFFIVSKDLINLSSSRSENIGLKNITHNDSFFWTKIWNGKIAFSSIIRSEVPLKDKEGAIIKNATTMFIGAPIINKKLKIVGALLLRINPYESYFKIFTAGRVGHSRETYGVNSKHKIVTPSRYPNPRINNSSKTYATKDCIKNRNGMNQYGYQSYSRKMVVGTWSWNKDLNICIISEISKDEAYSTLKVTNNILWIVASILSMILIGVISFYSKARRVIEDERYQKRVVNNDKLASLGEMAGGLAHEINTPLSAIILNLDELQHLILEDKFSKDILTEITEDTLSSANAITRIVQGIKSFSRNGANDALTKIDIVDVINRSISICENSLKLCSIELKFTHTSEVYILGSSSSLMQVFINLLNNSKDALISLNKERWISIDIDNQKGKNYLKIIFTDSGPGIPKEIRHKIFDLFFTTKDVGEGTGLGLGISYKIIQAHGGEIIVDENNNNTSFIITLPLWNSSNSPLRLS